MKTAIFLGAGASAAEGAPIQTNLFKDYFKLIKNRDRYPVFRVGTPKSTSTWRESARWY